MRVGSLGPWSVEEVITSRLLIGTQVRNSNSEGLWRLCRSASPSPLAYFHPPPIFLDSITLCRAGWPQIYRDQSVSCFQSACIKGLLLKITFIYLFCVWSDLRVPTCEGQVTTSRNGLSPPTTWLPRIKLRLPGLVASTVAHRALSPAPTPSLLGHLRRSPSRGSETRPWSGESVAQEQEAC